MVPITDDDLVIDPSFLRTPSNPLHLPPELLLKVFSHLPKPRTSRWHSHAKFKPAVRNQTLLSATLVSKSWSAPAYVELYGSIQLDWGYSVGPSLIGTFSANPALRDLARRVDAYFACDSWKNEWLRTINGKAYLDTAESYWPTPTSGPFKGLKGLYHSRYLDPLADAALCKQLKQKPWPAETPQEAKGRDQATRAFWELIASLPNLRHLKVDQFERPISENLQRKLAPTFATLTSLDLRESNSTFSLSLIRDIEDITLCYHDAQEHLKHSIRSHRLTNLTHLSLEVDERDQVPLDLFKHFDHAKLVTLILTIPVERLSPFSNALPFLVSLESLHLQIAPSAGAIGRTRPPLYAIALDRLAGLHLRHLHLPIWPSATLLARCPPTIESLIVGFGHDSRYFPLNLLDGTPIPQPPIDDPDVETMVSLAEDALSWKNRYLPAMEVLGIEHFGYEHQEGDAEVQSRVLAVMGRAEKFEMRVHSQRYRDHETFFPGRWLPS